ncbi:hypothetical protein [Endozoicomonas sp. 8E]|uniref:hypothetical protein n=1 Tax=Endozoicomonas sp. 8E TaxID=3035692 RepID=UPI0029391A9E|nr:hypothetical protein [Endozoicomonas sp. 8E]WOG26690.1 hypothetical protein P6910_19380 [Endozoicomonas sp. 8E]
MHYFFQFSGIHAFLVGLLPFFMPTLLWQQGYSLTEIAVFIALSGLAYLFTLWVWEHLRSEKGSVRVVRASFLTEVLLVAGLFSFQQQADSGATGLILLAILNGIYGCFYWMAQRLLFKSISHSRNSGQHFGNFQILVAVMLKIGIVAGAFLLEQSSDLILFILSVLISTAGVAQTFKTKVAVEINTAFSAPAVRVSEVLRFRDSFGSRGVFFVDGLFLFLESYFWTLSLYFINRESLLELGGMMVILAIAVAALFKLVQTFIDRMSAIRLFRWAILLYAFSWLLRGMVDETHSTQQQYGVILVIAFLTSLFRLSFNKVFFDRSDKTGTHTYLLLKSYCSQLGVAVLFIVTALFLHQGKAPLEALQAVYFVSSILALVYFRYSWQTGAVRVDGEAMSGKNNLLIKTR